tara:strand:+ start:51 stop:182 length:132 start_codon:yes stop_codon:yes gene_type:complete
MSEKEESSGWPWWGYILFVIALAMAFAILILMITAGTGQPFIV